MYFVKANESYEAPIEENAVVDTDLAYDANEVSMECAMFAFEATHMAVDAYHEVLTEADGDGEKSMFGKFKDKMVAIKDKVVKFVKDLWQKLKNLFTKIIYWFTTRLDPVQVFLKRYAEKANACKAITVKHDYNNELIVLELVHGGASFIGGIVKKFFDTLSTIAGHAGATQAHMAADTANETLKAAGVKDQNGKDINVLDDKQMISMIMAGLPPEIKKQIEASGIKIESVADITKGFRAIFDAAAAAAKAEYKKQIIHTTGPELVKALRSHEIAVNNMKSFSAGIGNLFKSIEVTINKPDGTRGLSVGINPIYKLLAFISNIVSTTILWSQKLVLALRSDIKRAASGQNLELSEGGEAKKESAEMFGNMLESLTF